MHLRLDEMHYSSVSNSWKYTSTITQSRQQLAEMYRRKRLMFQGRPDKQASLQKENRFPPMEKTFNQE